jgi:hypothetical protein
MEPPPPPSYHRSVGEQMDIAVWAGLLVGAVALLAAAIYYLPARIRIVVDTPTSTARAEMRPLWGLFPTLYARSLPQTGVSEPLAVFNDVARIGQALMTPGLLDVAYEAITSLFALKPREALVSLGLNLTDPAQNVVVHTAAQAAMAMAPASLRERVTISRCEAPGAEVSMRFEVTASPARILAIRDRFRHSRAGREFQRRLKRKPKPVKRPVREVRAN